MRRRDFRLLRTFNIPAMRFDPVADPSDLTRKGVTSLGDLYYVWKDESASDLDARDDGRLYTPVYNKTFEGKPIRIGGRAFDKGLGCRSKTGIMFAGTDHANRLLGTVALDESHHGEDEGRFRIFNEDFFGNRVIWDSGKMTRETPAKEFDVKLDGCRCLMFTFEGGNSKNGKPVYDILGVIGDPRVVADN